MLYGDIPAGMRLKTAADWNQTEADWKLYLGISPGGCFAAVFRGKVVGTVTTTNYANSVGWIGMMLVDPEYRRRGIASRLMQHAIEHLSECETIKLDATPAGKKVYDRLGFREEYSLCRMTTATAPYIKTTNTEIIPITDDDFTEIAKTDEAVFGADRMPVLQFLAHHNPGTARKLIRNDTITGYCMGRPGTNFYQVGPIVAETEQDALDLIKEILSNLKGQAVVIDVPGVQRNFLKWLVSCGFTKERPFIRMYYGSNAHPGLPEKVFGISGPELG